MTTSPGWSRLVFAALAVGALASPVAACSIGMVTPYRSQRDFHFLGRATRDTIFTGPGQMRPTTARGHLGTSNLRTVYGQRILVDRVGAPWLGVLPAQTRSVILVPWDYDSMCSPTYYSRSARWIPDATQGLFNGVLRDKAEWINGEPTFDVEFANYYGAGRGHGLGVPDSLARLLPAEYLSLMEALPSYDSLQLDKIKAFTPLHGWSANHKELTGIFPASEVIRYARWEVEDNRSGRSYPAVAGTYRVSVTLPWRETVTFFATTDAFTRHDRSWRDRGDSLKQPEDEDGDPIAYVLYSQHAWVEDSLFKQPAYSGWKNRVPLPAFVGYDAVVRTRDSVVFRGLFDGLRIATGLERDSTRKARLTELLTRSEAQRADAFFYLPGMWILRRGAPIRFEWTARNEKEVFYTVTAQQVSEWVLKE